MNNLKCYSKNETELIPISTNNDQNQNENNQNPTYNKSFLKLLITLFIIFCLLALSVPINKIRLDPEPQVVSYDDIYSITLLYSLKLNSSLNNSVESINKQELARVFIPNDAIIKQIANEIAEKSCEQQTRAKRICYAKAIYYFVQQNIDYVNDPVGHEYVAGPKQTLLSKAGDCDDIAVLLANLEAAIGIDVRFVLTYQHMYVQIKLDEALKQYKDTSGWINLDATCKTCKFGEIAEIYKNMPKQYISI